ncbi:MAG: patatin-like phospholipase family protein [Burkholderiaceae bacterium]
MSPADRHSRRVALRRIDPTRRRPLAGSGALAPWLAGCSFGAGTDHSGRHAPAADPTPLAGLPARPWALVLSTGGPRGFVHVGVLRALDELGVRPDLIVGASVGALVAALYCGGLSGASLTRIALEMQPWSMFALAIGAEQRFSGAPIARFVAEQLDDTLLQDLRPRCAIVALRQASREPVVFTRGDAGVAVQASAAIEGRLTPVWIHGQAHVDPDLVMPLPVRIARRLGAARVLSIDASAHEDKAPAGAERYRDGDRIKRALTEPDARAADLNLHPDFGYWVSLGREFREKAMDAGYRETMAQREKILRLTRAENSAI